MAGNFGSPNIGLSCLREGFGNSFQSGTACADGLGRPQWSVAVPTPAVIVKHSGNSSLVTSPTETSAKH